MLPAGDPVVVDEWAVTPSGADSADLVVDPTAALTADMAAAAQAWAELGMEAGEHNASIELAEGAQPNSPVTISVQRAEPAPAGAAVVLAYWDDHAASPDGAVTGQDGPTRAGDWVPVPSQLSVDRTTVSATVDHLSYWTDLVVPIGESMEYLMQGATGARGAWPECSGAGPSWSFFGSSSEVNDPVLYCYGNDPAHPDQFVVKLTNNRGYGQWVTPTVAPQWSYSDSLTLFDPGEANVIVRDFIGDTPVSDWLEDRVFVPAGGQAHFGFTREQASAATDGRLLTVSADGLSLAAGAMYGGLVELYGDKHAAIAALVVLQSVALCGTNLHGGTDALAVAGAVTSCILDRSDVIVTAAIEASVRLEPDLDLDSRVTEIRTLKRMVSALSAALVLRDAAELNTQILQGDRWDFVIDLAPAADPPAQDSPITELLDLTEPREWDSEIFFTSPSGNIRCVVTYYTDPEDILCDVIEADWGAPADPDCEVDWAANEVYLGGSFDEVVEVVVGACRGDTAFAGDPFVLPYGHAVQAGSIRCESRESGMTCVSEATGRGFRVSRGGYELLTR